MKKMYMTPSLETVKIQTLQFMMMSTLGETDATSGNLVREFDMESDFDMTDKDDLGLFAE